MHCFNDYGKNKGRDCPDLEVRYFIECSDMIDFDEIDHRRRKRSPIVCQPESIDASIQTTESPFQTTIDQYEDSTTGSWEGEELLEGSGSEGSGSGGSWF